MNNIKRGTTSVKTNIVTYAIWIKNKFLSLSVLQKIIVALALGGLLFFGIRQLTASDNSQKVITETVQRADIVEYVSETGNVKGSGSAEVFSPSTGIAQEVYVSNGDYVEVGQPLFYVQSTASEEEKAKASADLASASNNLKKNQQEKLVLKTQLEEARKKILDGQNAVDEMNIDRRGFDELEIYSLESALTSARENFDSLEKKYLDADSSINAAQAALYSSNLAYKATQSIVVNSTTSGTVLNLSIRPGDKVSASSASSLGISPSQSQTTAAPVLNVSNSTNSPLEIVVSLNESDIVRVESGQEADITIDAIPQKNFKGVVQRVDDIGTNTQGVITYNVYISFLENDKRIKSEMTASVDIKVAEARNAISVPNTAVQPYKGNPAVRIFEGETIKFVNVETGVEGVEKTEIKKGLDEGQEIVISSPEDEGPATGRSGGFF